MVNKSSNFDNIIFRIRLLFNFGEGGYFWCLNAWMTFIEAKNHICSQEFLVDENCTLEARPFRVLSSQRLCTEPCSNMDLCREGLFLEGLSSFSSKAEPEVLTHHKHWF